MLVTCTQHGELHSHRHTTHTARDTRAHTQRTPICTHISPLTAVWFAYIVNRLAIDRDCALTSPKWKCWSIRAFNVCVHIFIITENEQKNQIESCVCIGVFVQCSIDTVCAFYLISPSSLFSVYVCINDICLFDSFKSFHPKKLSISCWVFELKPNTMNRLRVYRSISLEILFKLFLQ